jgi:DNA-3-methyladenine glycosylase II
LKAKRSQKAGEGALDADGLAAGLARLVRIDPDLRRVHARFGPPPLWARDPGFPTLIHIILEQQVSLASARAAFDKLAAAISPVTPAGFLTLSDRELLQIGFSRQKASYVRHLSEKVLGGEIDLEALARHPDDAAVKQQLMKLKGIGSWTADIYLLMALLRRDVWPTGDLALAVALREVKGLDQRPGPEQMEEIAVIWRPYRAVAARLLWHHYLSTPRRPRE